jgi:hypothetical protein
MSMKVTIAEDSTFHIYRDLGKQEEDDGGAFLELNDAVFDIRASDVNWPVITIFLTEEVLSALRKAAA